MKDKWLSAALVLMTLGVGGCVVIDAKTEEPCPLSEPDEVTIREIEAVGKLTFDNDRCRGYKNIAERPGLGDRAQVHLVEAAFKRLTFENAKVDVLLTLVHNPCFSPAAKAALLDRLDRLTFESNKRTILEALNKKT
ncbi:MAG: hypothetical protein FJ280_27150 [Planctomycetes bacterium]|nr:hypothetical protein [Planctomycetota bacterium]